MEADFKSDWNGDSTEEAPRTTAILDKGSDIRLPF
jgi:hypothetical protein